ncbi:MULTISPECIES: translation initiation factor IF-2 [Peptoniphilus]|uniref:translation initiation factor IF-2 n=1 Tax=Peptoniphilus TaxID=162289 RepID=UPI0008D94B07|nr:MULTISPECIES: translation initiation factor IF-2 [Peptoniphilus]MBS6609988.1 translation initiation factor IF-2 [Peptoniphilus harei]MDU2115595.1 translation initiation factor IF-2 [Peptoniphilus lacydonensis]MDU5376863.1 translation initiation factor IF-2 [Peptoniphilus lacydonensis]MDU5436424.1 translation initiation factor IF-2 [Peptoniphilus lacydonensis]MDU7301723.1 translation initiation factor IF-2 [Peptoniphilus lacydonensis]
MSKIRVHALAKEIGISSKELILKLHELEIPIKNHMSTLSSADEEKIRNLYTKNSFDKKSPVKNNNSKNRDENINIRNQGKKNSKNKEKKEERNSLKKQKSKNSKVKDENISEYEDEKHNKSNNRKSNNNFKNKNSYNRDLTKKKPKKKVKSKHKSEEKSEGDDPIKVIAPITVKDFSDQLGVSISTVITKLIGLGIMANQNQSIDEDTCILLADELGIEIDMEEPNLDESVEEEYGLLKKDKERDLKLRPPVVTVMGHVDHGKTSLLDSIKSTHVTQSEAGGITQHIGAYTVNLSGKKITFLDTPGHEAFTSMRLRGAQTTDIAVLVVAADDGVMPQTVEAISHARSADVPIIVAITKIDKPEANPEKVKQDLMNENLVAEEWGGDTIVVGVSSKTGEGIDELLEMILLVAEMKELKANPNRRAIGTIIEANLDKSKGPMATILIKNGTLRFGDSIVSGICSGRIRAMEDDKGKKVKKAGPSMPVVVLGLNDVPNAGDTIYAVKDDKTAKAIADKNAEISREKRLSQTTKISLDNLFEKISEEDVKELNIVVKADVKGSVEALNQSLLKLSTEEVKISIIHSGVGGINESDVTLASASNAIVIGFNVRPNMNAIELAKEEEVEIRTYRVIYEIINDIEQAAKGMLDPDIVEEILGRCEVRQTFKLPNNQMVAGVYVLNGKILRNAKVKVLRDDVVIHEGDISSLKRFKDDVKELAQGYEGGLVIDGFNDIKENDLLEAYILKEVERS